MDKLLQQFLAIAEAGSLSAAATRLRITQPTLTFNMRKLEESLSVTLFKRSSRGIQLTPYGETLYQNARVMQRLYDNMIGTIADQRVENERGIAMGSGYSWWSLFVREALLRYQEDFPNAPVQISLGDQMRCLDQLLSGDIALFISHEIRGLGPDLGLEFNRIGYVYNVAFVREGHPLLGKKRSDDEIKRYPVATSLLPERRQRRLLDERWDTSAETRFGHSHIAFGSNSLSACIDYLHRTDAILRYSHVIGPHLAEHGLAQVEQKEMPPKIPVGIYALAERRSDHRVAEVIRRLASAAEQATPPLLAG